MHQLQKRVKYSFVVILVTSLAISVWKIAFLFFQKDKLHKTKSADIRAAEYSQFFITTTETITFPQVSGEVTPNTRLYPNEDSRVGASLLKSSNVSSYFRPVKLIFLATPFFGSYSQKHFFSIQLGKASFERYKCPISECVATNDVKLLKASSALLFHLRDIVINAFPTYRRSSQRWILYTMEPPWLELTDLDKFNGVFNWTMSYREDSDVVVRYGFIGKSPLPRTDIVRNNTSGKFNRAAWFVSNCCTESRREFYVKELMKYYPVDVYGGCGKDVCKPAETSKCYRKVLAKYKFYLSFENSICNDYVTEKLFNVLEYDIIPVVFGGATYSRIVPEHSVINALNFKNPSDLAAHLHKLSSDDDLYNSYFTWKRYFRSYHHLWMCDLCEKLHTAPMTTSIKTNLKQWWLGGAKCKRWIQNKLELVEAPVFPCYNTHNLVS